MIYNFFRSHPDILEEDTNTYALEKNQVIEIVHTTRNFGSSVLYDLFLKVLLDKDFDENVRKDCLEYFAVQANTHKDKVCLTLRAIALYSPTLKKETLSTLVRTLININPGTEFMSNLIEDLPTDRREFVLTQVFHRPTPQ